MSIGVLLSGLAGGGNAVADIGKDMQRVEDEARMTKLRADASLDLQNRIAEAQIARENAVSEKAGVYVRDASAPRPVVAAPVTELVGIGAGEGYQSPDGTATPGLTGNLVERRAEIMTAPDSPERAMALEMLDKQIARTQEVAAKAVEGKVAEPPPEERLQIAVENALAAGDIASAKMLKALVETKASRYLNAADGVFDTLDRKWMPRNVEKIASEEAKEALRLKVEQEREDRRDKRQQDLIAERTRADEERANRSDIRAEDRENKKDERLANKPLVQPVIKSLQETRDNAVSINNLTKTFKPEYADKGVMGVGADASMSAKAIMGWDKDAVEWWKTYKKQAELVERHAMFGASLTPGEQASWRSADIAPGMDADVINTNIKARAELAKTMLENTRSDYVGAGYSEKRIGLIVDRGLKQLGDEKLDADRPAAGSAKPSLDSIFGP